MELVLLTEELVKALAVNKDMVSVKEFPSDDPDTIIIQVIIDNSDMGRVIGKAGKIANSIRTIVQASSYLKDNKRVKINIVQNVREYIENSNNQKYLKFTNDIICQADII